MQTFSLITTTGLTLLPPPTPPLRKFSGNQLHYNTKNISQMGTTRYNYCTKISASYDHHHHNMVDENMIVLRLRIHEMKMFETFEQQEEEEEKEGHDATIGNDEVRFDKKWMQWEKYYYENDYKSDVCEAVGILQGMLMETRPSFALAIALGVLLSVPISMTLLAFHFMEFVKVLLVKAAPF
ncbi:hypothetical protein ACFE04_018347 [Oxalis oulophora]